MLRSRFGKLGRLFLALCAIGPLAWGAPWASPTAVTPGTLDESLSLLGRFEAERAMAVVDQALALEPDSAALQGVKGLALFYLGRYEEAVEWLDRAARGGSGQDSLVEVAEVARRTRSVVSVFATYSSEHFQLFLDEAADGVLVPYVLETLEQARREIGKDLGYSPPDVVRVEIYPTADAFYQASGLTGRDIEVSGAVGLCRYNKIMALSPRALIKGYRWLDALSHEYVHFVLARRTWSNLPIWLHEGVARYEEVRWRMAHPRVLDAVSESLLARALRAGGFIKFAAMEPSLVALDTPHDVHLAYAECEVAVEWIVERRGVEGIREILDALGKPERPSVEEVLGSVLGLSAEAFEEALRGWLAERGLREVEGVELPRYMLAEAGAPLELEEIKSLAASQLTGLADRLRARGRLEPAVAEYKRALHKSPHEVVILTRLGVALMETGRHEEARERFESVLERAPDAVTAHKYLGLIALSEGRYEEAGTRMVEAVRINPFDPELHGTLALVYSRLGNGELEEREEKAYQRLTGTSSMAQ